MNRYSAQKQYWKAKQAKQGNHTEAALLKKLQVSAPSSSCGRQESQQSRQRVQIDRGEVHRQVLSVVTF